MSFFKSLFGSKAAKKFEHPYDKWDFRRIYEEAKELFLRGKHDQALESFKSIYENDCAFRDVATIIEDYFVMPKHMWIAKYKVQFRAQLSKESGDDAGTGGAGTGSAPVPAPKQPITPLDSFRAERRPDENDRAA